MNACAPKDAKAVKPKITVFYNVANWFKTSYRKIKGWFKVVVVVGLGIAAGFFGCQYPRRTGAPLPAPLIVHELDGRAPCYIEATPLQHTKMPFEKSLQGNSLGREINKFQDYYWFKTSLELKLRSLNVKKSCNFNEKHVSQKTVHFGL